MRRFNLLLLVSVLSVSPSTSITVDAETGQNVTLMCTYNAKPYPNGLPACWSRGALTSSGCYSEIIATDGSRVKPGSRSRYQLLGPVEEGNVSLTILRVTEADTGVYGCRVEIPGWFNDKKHQVHLTVRAAPRTTLPTTTHLQEAAESTTAADPTGQQTSTAAPLTSSSHGVEAEDNSDMTLILVLVLFAVIILVTSGAIVARRLSRSRRMCQQQVGSSIRFSSTSSSLQLHRQSSAVENIYQMDENEYDFPDAGATSAQVVFRPVVSLNGCD